MLGNRWRVRSRLRRVLIAVMIDHWHQLWRDSVAERKAAEAELANYRAQHGKNDYYKSDAYRTFQDALQREDAAFLIYWTKWLDSNCAIR